TPRSAHRRRRRGRAHRLALADLAPLPPRPRRSTPRRGRGGRHRVPHRGGTAPSSDGITLMNRYRTWIIAVVDRMCPVLMRAFRPDAALDAVRHGREPYTHVAGASDTYECNGDRDARVREITDHKRPDARAGRQRTEYLRYGN